MQLPITFRNQTYTIEIFIVPEIQDPLILGMNFWRIFNIFAKHLDAVELVDKSCSLPTNSLKENTTHLSSYDNLNEFQKEKANDIITQFRKISYEECGLGRTTLISHAIDTGDAVPIRQRYYRMSPEKQRVLVEKLDEMLQDDVVEPCESPWSSPAL